MVYSRVLISGFEIFDVKDGLGLGNPSGTGVPLVSKDRAHPEGVTRKGVVKSLLPLLICWVTSHCPPGAT